MKKTRQYGSRAVIPDESDWPSRYDMPTTENWQKWLLEKYFKSYPKAREKWAEAGFYDLEHGCVSDLALLWYDDMLAMNEPATVPTGPEMRMYREGNRRTNQGWSGPPVQTQP